MLEKIRALMDGWLPRIAAILFLISVMATFAGVVDRTFGLNLKTVWAEELTRFSMIWGALLLIGIGIRKGTQTRLTLLSDRLPPGGKKFMHVFVLLAVSLLFALLFVFGLRSAFTNRSQMSAVMQVSMFWPYLAIPVSAFFVLFECLADVWETLRGTGRNFSGMETGLGDSLPTD